MAGFKRMQKTMEMVKFNQYCATLASDYGRSESKYTGGYFADQNGISEKCFWQVLDYAVIHYLVEDWVVNLMESKASGNQAEHGSTGMQSLRHYQNLRDLRRQFVFNLARDFARDEGNSIADFLEKYGRTGEGLQKILEDAMEKADYYGLSPDMVTTIQFRIFFELMPAIMKEREKDV